MSRFAEHNRLHKPVWERFTLPQLAIESLLETSGVGDSQLDDVRVTPLGGSVTRFSVCDPALGYVDARRTARHAGQRGLDVLDGGAELEVTFNAVNAELYRRGATRSTSISLTCLAAVDWDLDSGEVQAYRAGDCQVLVHSSGRWHTLFDSEILKPEARAAWASAAPQRARRAHLADHDRILGHPEAWVSAPLGQFERPILQRASIGDVEAVAIASDGLLLDECAVTNLESAWAGIHDRPQDWPHDEPHGDIAALIARRC